MRKPAMRLPAGRDSVCIVGGVESVYAQAFPVAASATRAPVPRNDFVDPVRYSACHAGITVSLAKAVWAFPWNRSGTAPGNSVSHGSLIVLSPISRMGSLVV